MDSISSWQHSPAWMSLWDKYFAPGDVRRRRQLELSEATLQPNHDHKTQSSNLSRPVRADAAQAARRQGALLYGGIGFTILSVVVTRRTMRRKTLQTYPQTFTPSNGPPPKVDGGLEAVEALGLASLNVFSIAMAAAGGLMTYFDIADVEELKYKMRKVVGSDVNGGDPAADKELEGWVAEVLTKKDGSSGSFAQGVVEKLMELEKKTNEREKSDEKK